MAKIRTKARQTLERPFQQYAGRRDKKALVMLFPKLEQYRQLVSSLHDSLRPIYDEYVSTISSKWMACSWESACFLYSMMMINKPTRILDLGSGFSSIVTRLYKLREGREITVFSVDDNEFWLGKTESFLHANGVSTENLLSWSHFNQSVPVVFDLIFNDLGTTTLRVSTLEFVAGLMGNGSIMILDDMHKPRYPRVVKKNLKQLGCSFYSARYYTLDNLGRFASVAIKRDLSSQL